MLSNFVKFENTCLKYFTSVLYLNKFSGILVIPIFPLHSAAIVSNLVLYLNKFSGISVILELVNIAPIVFTSVLYLNKFSGILVIPVY